MQNMQYDYLDSTYRVLAALGSREEKTTYLAQDTVTEQIVVKKYVSLEHAAIYEQMKEIHHKNLISVYHVARGEDKALVIMEYVSGRTLEEYLREKRTFSEEETICYMSQVFAGLAEIHGRNIIHRDIKPGNLLVSSEGVVKILDFDIGRTYKPETTHDTQILGTWGYAAPEQYGGAQCDRRTDIYAAGVVMNEMLTGKLPIEQPYREGKLADIIQKCIRIGPENRYDDANEVLRELHSQLGKKTGKTRGNTCIRNACIANACIGNACILPGFRSGTWWKMLLASWYYVSFIVSFFMILMTSGSGKEAAGNLILLIVAYLMPFLALFDFLGWMEKVPQVRELNRFGKTVTAIVVAAILFVAGCALGACLL